MTGLLVPERRHGVAAGGAHCGVDAEDEGHPGRDPHPEDDRPQGDDRLPARVGDLGRYTHRIARSNARLEAFDEQPACLEQHAYDRSRFLRGAAVDEDKIPVVESGEVEAEELAELQYLNPASPRVHLLDKVLSLDDAQEAVYRLPPPLILIFFSWANVKTLFFEHEELAPRQQIEVLRANYRNAVELAELANRLLRLMLARFGSIDRESHYLVEALPANLGQRGARLRPRRRDQGAGRQDASLRPLRGDRAPGGRQGRGSE